MQYVINDKIIQYHALGERQWGDDVIILDHATDLTLPTPWHHDGFTVQKLFPDDLQKKFQSETKQLLYRCWSRTGIAQPQSFALEEYHTVFDTFEKHRAAVAYTKLLSTQDFPVPIQLLEQRISEICGQSLEVKNPFDNQSVFHFRVIRPDSTDNNPLHRDVWLEDYDDCINLYIPIAGSNELSSLILIPESHRWMESRIEKTVAGAIINGIRFNVPAVTDIRGSYTVARAVPQENEVLVFSPYLIHGGAVNLNASTTRISLEIRLWKR